MLRRKVPKNKQEEVRIQALMEEGYREMAEENLRLTQEHFEQDVELLLRYTRWDKTPHK